MKNLISKQFSGIILGTCLSISCVTTKKSELVSTAAPEESAATSSAEESVKVAETNKPIREKIDVKSKAEEPKPKKKSGPPVATPIPGEKGYVYSPFSREGKVDVSELRKGSEAYCPYTNKIFLVP